MLKQSLHQTRCHRLFFGVRICAHAALGSPRQSVVGVPEVDGRENSFVADARVIWAGLKARTLARNIVRLDQQLLLAGIRLFS